MEVSDMTGHFKDTGNPQEVSKKKSKCNSKFNKNKSNDSSNGKKWCKYHKIDIHSTKDCDVSRRNSRRANPEQVEALLKSSGKTSLNTLRSDKTKKELNALKNKAKKVKKELNSISEKVSKAKHKKSKPAESTNSF
jgi:hypothetical protein